MDPRDWSPDTTTEYFHWSYTDFYRWRRTRVWWARAQSGRHTRVRDHIYDRPGITTSLRWRARPFLNPDGPSLRISATRLRTTTDRVRSAENRPRGDISDAILERKNEVCAPRHGGLARCLAGASFVNESTKICRCRTPKRTRSWWNERSRRNAGKFGRLVEQKRPGFPAMFARRGRTVGWWSDCSRSRGVSAALLLDPVEEEFHAERHVIERWQRDGDDIVE